VIGELRRFGVDTSRIVRGKGRLGIYFVETGANQRPSKVIYDREFSAIAIAKPGEVRWDNVLQGASWFHITASRRDQRAGGCPGARVGAEGAGETDYGVLRP